MKEKKPRKHCAVCGKELCRINKTGYCREHRPRTGENNPFFGKHHSPEFIEQDRIRSRESTKRLWQDSRYRQKVIEGKTGKTRSEEFKETQRKNSLNQFADPEQRRLRSERMKRAWQEGTITKIPHKSYNKSKQEKTLHDELSKLYNTINDKSIIYSECGENKWLLPDIIIDNIVVEYNGSYWHADPRKYEPEDIVHHNYTAQQIWDKDKHKKEIYERLGYKVICVWSDDFMHNREDCLCRLINEINQHLQNRNTEEDYKRD